MIAIRAIVSSLRTVASEIKIEFQQTAPTPIHIKENVARSCLPHSRVLVCFVCLSIFILERPDLALVWPCQRSRSRFHVQSSTKDTQLQGRTTDVLTQTPASHLART